MKKTMLAVLLVVAGASPAYAMTYYLTAQWLDGGNRFCKYGNGTVLNMGYKLCPLSIDG